MAEDIIWFIEHPARELDVACAVQAWLKKRHDITLAILPYHQSYPRQTLDRYHPSLVLVPYCYFVRDSGLRDFLPHWKQATYLNLSWEELFYTANQQHKAPRDLFAKRHVLHHAWSTDYRHYLLSYGVPAEHIIVNGNPVYALYDLPYRRIFPDKKTLLSSLGLDPARKIFFFPENYSWAFYSADQLRQIILNGQSPATVTEMKTYCESSFATVMAWIKEATEKTDAYWVLRPRPATDEQQFRSAVRAEMGKIPDSVIITKEGSVREWILQSDFVLSSFSTSLIEAAVAGIPAYMLEPSPLPQSLQADWYQYASRITNRKTFQQVYTRKTPSSETQQLGQWAKRTMLSQGDPIKKLAEIIVSIKEKKRVVSGTITDALLKQSDAQHVQQSAVRKLGARLVGRVHRVFHGYSGDRNIWTQYDVSQQTQQFLQLINV